MPNPEEGCDNVNSIFREHIFKFVGSGRGKKELTAAIMGAHTIGSAKIDNSGYQGTWTSTEDMGTFNNGYFQSMLLKGWGPDIAVNGNADKNQWKRVDLTANDLATDN